MVGSGLLSAQQLTDTYMLNAPQFRETYFVETDKHLYASGETVYFRIFNLSHPLLKNNNWSTVFYLEVINARNVPVAQGKYPIDQAGSIGSLILPDTLSSGNYYIRGYTRWMRNFPASGYVYVPMAIVNPERLNLEELDYLTRIERGGNLIGRERERLKEHRSEPAGIDCEPDRQSYAKREKVTVQIRTDETVDLSGGLAVSVVKLDYMDTTGSCYSGWEKGIPQGPESVLYAPETRGVSLDGTIVQGEDEQPAPYATIHLTLLGEKPDYLGLVSDQNGRIRFAIPPRVGANNALVTFNANGGSTLKLILEDAFSNDFLQQKLPGKNLSGYRMEVLEEMMIYVQLKQAFGIIGSLQDQSSDSASLPHFYGSPEYRYHPADYIPIPNLEEFLFELVPKVVIRKRKQEYMVALQDNAGFYLDYAPLILLDHVAVQDMEALFSIDPRNIEYIDVINTSYIRGGNYYGGILSIISKEGNLAGVELPEGSTIIDLQTYQNGQENLPQAITPPSGDAHLPDLRTLLYWNPSLPITDGHQTRIGFSSSDIGGSYVVTVTGMTASGTIISGRCFFRVDERGSPEEGSSR